MFKVLRSVRFRNILPRIAVTLLLGGLATGTFAQASTLLSDPAITADEAKAAALEAYPGTNAVEKEILISSDL